jgi:hypothetical protein
MIPRLFLVFGVHIQKNRRFVLMMAAGSILGNLSAVTYSVVVGELGSVGLAEGLTGRVADPTLFGLTCVNPPPSAGGLAGARVADPTLFGLICVNPPPSAVGLHALSINGCCRKEDGSG